jgi:Patatin-like phospholipase
LDHRTQRLLARRSGVWLVCLASALSGCGSLPRNAVPPELVDTATIAGMADARAWLGQPDPSLERDLAESFAQESVTDFPHAADGSVHYAHLALSGGGANGAFGAGFLNGWTRAGTRPVFKIVTGVSTGALMAPFAFVGSRYDDALREFYTTVQSRDIFVRTGSMLRQMLTGESLVTTAPLAALIEQHVDARLLAEVAAAHLRGRRLYIGTVDLDVPRFVVWNMGLIATSGQPQALDLFRRVMLASASIPVAFPPVFFEVEAEPGGPRYDEMHVDGGVGARVFLNGGLFRASVIRQRGGLGEGREDIFVIHNGQLIAAPTPVRRSLSAIALRSIDASGRAAVVGDLFRIYVYALEEQASFQWITIPNDVSMERDETFDPARMRALYEVGFRIAADGAAWSTTPPGQARDP